MIQKIIFSLRFNFFYIDVSLIKKKFYLCVEFFNKSNIEL